MTWERWPSARCRSSRASSRWEIGCRFSGILVGDYPRRPRGGKLRLSKRPAQRAYPLRYDVLERLRIVVAQRGVVALEKRQRLGRAPVPDKQLRVDPPQIVRRVRPRDELAEDFDRGGEVMELSPVDDRPLDEQIQA